jgi:predicted XRE-type DNA-binding protein
MESEEVIENTVTYGTSDVFHDLGLPDADELLAKSNLAIAIYNAIQERGLTQARAAELMGIDQPKVSKIIRGRLSEFSTERLLKYLLLLGLNIEVIIHKEVAKDQREGTMSVAYV